MTSNADTCLCQSQTRIFSKPMPINCLYTSKETFTFLVTFMSFARQIFHTKWTRNKEIFKVKSAYRGLPQRK